MPNQEEQGETATRNKPTDKGSDAEEGQDIFKLASENLHLIWSVDFVLQKGRDQAEYVWGGGGGLCWRKRKAKDWKSRQIRKKFGLRN